MRRFISLLVLTFALPAAVFASGDTKHLKQVNWAFDGVFGKTDKPSIQRGLQVYREVCAACHGLNRVAFRTLTDVGFSEAEVKTMAAEYTVTDGPNDDGDMFERPARPSDKFPAPYANEKAARAAQNGAYPPDLSLIVKSRQDGANYIYSLLTGYEDAPADVTVPEGMHYNPYFAGHLIAMTSPLKEGAVDFQDGTSASVDQMSHDVVNFLQWASEPEMETRKRMGIRVIIFLTIMTGFFYVAKKRIWKDLH
jgi:ubiquinol-cytochrome c reductase cytochrome c1 subunit